MHPSHVGILWREGGRDGEREGGREGNPNDRHHNYTVRFLPPVDNNLCILPLFETTLMATISQKITTN